MGSTRGIGFVIGIADGADIAAVVIMEAVVMRAVLGDGIDVIIGAVVIATIVGAVDIEAMVIGAAPTATGAIMSLIPRASPSPGIPECSNLQCAPNLQPPRVAQ